LGVGIAGCSCSTRDGRAFFSFSAVNTSALGDVVAGCGLTSGGDELDVAGVSCELLCAVVGMEVVDEAVLPADNAPEMSRSRS